MEDRERRCGVKITKEEHKRLEEFCCKVCYPPKSERARCRESYPCLQIKAKLAELRKRGGTVKTDYKKLVRKLAEADKECTRAKKALHQHNAFWYEDPVRYGRDNCEQVRMGGGVCCHGKTDFDPDTGKPIYAGDWPVDEWCEFCRIRQPLYLAVRAASRKRSLALQSVLRAGRREMEAGQ